MAMATKWCPKWLILVTNRCCEPFRTPLGRLGNLVAIWFWHLHSPLVTTPVQYPLQLFPNQGIRKRGAKGGPGSPIFGTTKTSASLSLIFCSPKLTHEANRGPMKGAMSAKKTLEGSETETSWEERKNIACP